MAKKWHISVRLLINGVNVAQVVKKTNLIPVKEFKLENCLLYVNKSKDPQTPEWASSLLEIPSTYKLTNKNSSALLFVTIESGRIMILSFGSGYMSIKDEYIEPNFGLITVLNEINERTLRSMDLITPEINVTQKRIQKSSFSEISDFGISKDRELLKRISGNPKDGSFSRVMTGADGLTLKCELSKKTFVTKCEVIWNKYQETKYKEKFGWIDNVKVLKDNNIIEKLNKLVLKDINSSLKTDQMPSINLSPPTIVDFDEIEHFKFSGFRSTKEFTELSIGSYIDSLKDQDIEKLKLGDLKKHRVLKKLHDNDNYSSTWNLLKCIVAEYEIETDKYLSFAGNWYHVDKNYYAEIDSKFQHIVDNSSGNPGLPAFDPIIDTVEKTKKNGDKYTQASENAYNDRLCRISEDYTKMDCESIHNTEVCDIVSNKNQLIHMKRWKSSSLMSHLLNQAIVSAQAFKQSPEYRKEIRDTFPHDDIILSVFPEAKPIANNYEINLGIIDERKRGKHTLPFFSKVTLINAFNELNGSMEFNVNLWWIDAK